MSANSRNHINLGHSTTFETASKVGGNWYENVGTILKFCDTPIISCRIEDGQARVSLTIMDDSLHQVLIIKDNEITFRVDDLWDFEYGHRNAVARRAKGDILLRMDFRGDESLIEGRIWLGGQKVDLNPDRMVLPGNNQFIGNRISGSLVGVQIGDPETVLPVRCRLPK